MFQKLKHLLQDWARKNNDEEKFDPEKIPVNFIKSEDKQNNLLFSKPTKSSHRNIVKEDSGLVRGYVQEVNIVPRNCTLFSKSKKEFADLGQRVHSRRKKLTYRNFDDFAADLKEIAEVETVFEKKHRPETDLFEFDCY